MHKCSKKPYLVGSFLFVFLILSIFALSILRGRVKFPTGGDSPRLFWTYEQETDSVKFRNRQLKSG